MSENNYSNGSSFEEDIPGESQQTIFPPDTPSNSNEDLGVFYDNPPQPDANIQEAPYSYRYVPPAKSE
jgi:hypothetical protein